MQVTLFTQPNCHLCDVIKLELQDLQDEFSFELIEQNILSDKTLLQRYRLRIPVVLLRQGDIEIEQAAPINQIELRQQIKRLATPPVSQKSYAQPS